MTTSDWTAAKAEALETELLHWAAIRERKGLGTTVLRRAAMMLQTQRLLIEELLAQRPTAPHLNAPRTKGEPGAREPEQRRPGAWTEAHELARPWTYTENFGAPAIERADSTRNDVDHALIQRRLDEVRDL